MDVEVFTIFCIILCLMLCNSILFMILLLKYLGFNEKKVQLFVSFSDSGIFKSN